jgi:hypothetical protein
MFGRGMNKTYLLRSEAIRKELGVSEEQATKIQEILTASREERRGLWQRPSRDATPEERTKAREEMAKKMEAFNKKLDAKLDKALKKEQVERLNQIMLQATMQRAPIEALTSDYVVKGLKLNKEQVKKLKAAEKARDDAMAKMRQDMRGGDRSDREAMRERFQKMREQMQEITEKAKKDAMAILTKEQKEGLEKLKGKDFDLQSIRPARRGGREGFRRGAGREGRPRGERRRPEGDA